MSGRSSTETLIREGLRELGAPEAAAPALDRLTHFLSRWSAHTNLTGHRDPDTIASRLVLDAAALGMVLPQVARIADLGSGAGFPGLPLAILRPDQRITLIEARERRHHFQRAAIRELEIVNARALRGRAEDLEPEPHDLVVAQAVASPARALDWMYAWCRPAGWLALPLGDPPPPLVPPSYVHECELRRYRVPLGGPARQLWLGRLAPSDSP
ncbi:MAG: 16S rRNA (guanine(527)-N(7))-methyltransferase RsmG [Myxococcota bacterium]|nr:16S rRNA (guanine(527)-N(7))-methyltransferase RsmG [Myxococcota bacterium]